MRSIFIVSHQQRKLFNAEFFPNYGSSFYCAYITFVPNMFVAAVRMPLPSFLENAEELLSLSVAIGSLIQRNLQF